MNVRKCDPPFFESFNLSPFKITPDSSLFLSPFFLHPNSHQRLLAAAQDHQLRGGEGSGSHQWEDAAAAGWLALRRQPKLPQQGPVFGDQRHRRQGKHQQRQQHPVKAGSRRHLGRRGRPAPGLITARHHRKGAKGEGVKRRGEASMSHTGGTSHLLVFGYAFKILVHSQIC